VRGHPVACSPAPRASPCYCTISLAGAALSPAPRASPCYCTISLAGAALSPPRRDLIKPQTGWWQRVSDGWYQTSGLLKDLLCRTRIMQSDEFFLCFRVMVWGFLVVEFCLKGLGLWQVNDKQGKSVHGFSTKASPPAWYFGWLVRLGLQICPTRLAKWMTWRPDWLGNCSWLAKQCVFAGQSSWLANSVGQKPTKISEPWLSSTTVHLRTR